MSKEQIRNWGIALTSFVLMLCVIAIILAGIDYQLAGPNFKSGFPYDTLPGLQIACIIYSFFMVGWGYIAYMRPSYGCTVSFIVFLVLSIIWNLSIGIFALVSYNVGFVNTYLSCNGQFSGIFSVWQGMDTYLQQVNDALCSDKCPCALTNTTGYVTNVTVLSMYKAMNRTDNKNGAVSFADCSDSVRYKTLEKAKEKDPLIESEGIFDPNNFAQYMSTMESYFQCAGWCNTTYKNSKNETTTMYKYLFTDINKGPALHSGCLDSMINWLPGYLGAYGSMTMVLAIVQIGLLGLSMMQCKRKENEIEDKIPHYEESKHIKE